MSEIEDFAYARPAGESWQEQRNRENLANFIQRMKKLIKSVEVSHNTAYVSEGRGVDPANGGLGGGVTGVSRIPDYLQKYADPNYKPASVIPRSEFVSVDNSPFSRNYKKPDSP